MLKESLVRCLIGLLLVVQVAVWFLNLLDLLSPGKPLCLIRNTTDVLIQFSRRSSALVYRGVSSRI
ncbi:uncharacterized protein BDR25DRAFT_218037 [Lindgomyces ingoldianus]|uniref:Uncharacterized protein n=1 Tax=Lindgomyces ingoldianus TaxID=673940 RepID=A0ACB6R2I1_9PLEO|nr:uncharacterized protein BDR25DRAFT_218037 [Lindgomyces ingoldianus]KAF2473386.1 hypothetical protein BDR25DRAFT_218037 [Lindgomyces ingoldianus]